MAAKRKINGCIHCRGNYTVSEFPFIFDNVIALCSIRWVFVSWSACVQNHLVCIHICRFQDLIRSGICNRRGIGNNHDIRIQRNFFCNSVESKFCHQSDGIISRHQLDFCSVLMVFRITVSAFRKFSCWTLVCFQYILSGNIIQLDFKYNACKINIPGISTGRSECKIANPPLYRLRLRNHRTDKSFALIGTCDNGKRCCPSKCIRFADAYFLRHRISARSKIISHSKHQIPIVHIIMEQICDWIIIDLNFFSGRIGYCYFYGHILQITVCALVHHPRGQANRITSGIFQFIGKDFAIQNILRLCIQNLERVFIGCGNQSSEIQCRRCLIISRCNSCSFKRQMECLNASTLKLRNNIYIFLYRISTGILDHDLHSKIIFLRIWNIS